MSDASHNCDPFDWQQCDTAWALAIFITNALSTIACLWYLCAFRRLQRDARQRIFPRQIWWLALSDSIYHSFWLVCVASELILPRAIFDNALHSETMSILLALVYPSSITVSFLVEMQVAAHCLATTFKSQAMLAILNRLTPWSCVIGIPLGLGFGLKVLPKIVKAVLMLSGFLVNILAYVVVMWWLVRGSPRSVQRRHSQRLVIYPMNFLITYTFCVVYNAGDVHIGILDVFALNITLSGLNGLFNVGAYVWQSRHTSNMLSRRAEGLSVGVAEPSASHIVVATADDARQPYSYNVTLLAAEVLAVESVGMDANKEAAAEASAIFAQQEQSLDRALVLREGGDILAERGEYGQALTEYTRCAVMQAALHAEDSSEYACSLSKGAEMMLVLRRFQAALVVYEHIVEIQRRLFGELSAERAQALRDVDRARELKRQHELSAFDIYKEALQREAAREALQRLRCESEALDNASPALARDWNDDDVMKLAWSRADSGDEHCGLRFEDPCLYHLIQQRCKTHPGHD